MMPGGLPSFAEIERKIYALISSRDGIKAKDIASELRISRADVNHWLFSSALMHELCFQDSGFEWHALIRQNTVHDGLYEFSGWYGTLNEFVALSDDEWLISLKEGCSRIGRNLSDTRGLIHSFTDCRKVISMLITDLFRMTGSD